LTSYGVRVRDSLWCVIICGALVVSIVRVLREILYRNYLELLIIVVWGKINHFKLSFLGFFSYKVECQGGRLMSMKW
jgi:hypothetical protein